MLFWGLNVSAMKVLVVNVDPLLLQGIRVFTAGIAVLVIAYFMKIFRLPTKREILIIFYICIFNVTAHHIFIALGLKNTSGVNAGLILGMSPLMVMMLSVIFLGKELTFLKVFGFILGFVGVAVTTLAGSGSIASISIGDLLILFGIVTQAFSFIMISKLNPNFDPRLLTGYMLVLGSIFIFLIGLVYGAEVSQIAVLFNWKLGSIFIFSALLCTAFGHMVYNFAIKQVGPAESAIFMNLNTFFALVGAAIFLNEVITFYHGIGLVLIVGGVLFGSGAVEYMAVRRKEKKYGL